MAFSLDHVVADIRTQSAAGEFSALAAQLQNYANELAQTDCRDCAGYNDRVPRF